MNEALQAALAGKVLLDDDDEKLVVNAVTHVFNDPHLLVLDKKGRFRLVDLCDVKDGTYQLFKDDASAVAYLADLEASAKAEAA